MYSRGDIKNAIREGHLKIYPFEEENLTGIGYNISTTNFAFSINRGILLTVHEDTIEQGKVHHVIIPAQDTVLFFSKELIETDNTIAGTFHSKVSRVCQGIGHISTTLDAVWKGQLIISVNNPTNRDIRFDLDRNTGNIMTLLISKLDNPIVGENAHDNNQGRCDLLLSHFKNDKKWWFFKTRHLELEKFIVDDFANSLNGYDDFINVENITDKYTKKISSLKKLKERLENNAVIIRENRYILGENGTYKILRNQEEEQLIKECTIFHFYPLSTDKEQEGYTLKDINDSKKVVLDRIEEYLSIIKYELETLNHKRRIIWQNRETEKYAAESSKIEKQRKVKKRFGNTIIVIGLFAIICGLGIYANNRWTETFSEKIFLAIFGMFTATLSGVIVAWINKKRG